MMKKINLLPWRELQNKLKIRQYIIIWFSISCLFLILLLIEKIIIIQQIKHYQFANDRLFLKVKNISPKVKELKNLQYKEEELKNIVKIIQINHQEIKKILEIINHLKYLITPDLFVRLVDFFPPYMSLIMHAKSKKEYESFKKLLYSKYGAKIKWLILNQYQNMQLDFIAQIFLTRNNFNL